jgi:hypothetical protein
LSSRTEYATASPHRNWDESAGTVLWMKVVVLQCAERMRVA